MKNVVYRNLEKKDYNLTPTYKSFLVRYIPYIN